MNLLFHERIKWEQYKDRLAEAAHWRLVKQLKQEQKKEDKPRLGFILISFLKAVKDWRPEFALIKQTSTKKTS